MIDPNKIKEYIKTLDPNTFGISQINNIELKELPKGNWNFNYVVKINDKKFVFKIYSPNREGFFTNSGEIEYKSLNAVKELNIAPRPILFDDTKAFFNYDVLVYEFVEGKRLSKFNDKIINKIASILAKLHSLNTNEINFLNKEQETSDGLLKSSIDAFKKYKERKDTIKEHIHLFEKIIQKLEKKKIVEIAHPLAVIHTDLVPGNFIVNKANNVFLIDWQCSKISDPAFDVWAVTNKTFNLWDLGIFMSEKQKRMLQEQYLKLKKDETILERIKIKEPLWLLVLSLYCLTRYTDFISGDIEIAKGRKENFERYRRALELGIEKLNEFLEVS